ncbi:hypothetical protein [Succinivibrio dextrinosolvens]|uniref:DUF669 domain-containing protein n=1 Tax=Succinivibrio dextrinosolvens TaxID=83771 RepID=A0A662Z5Y9_9GAMM|nr:hypothetical protein [Succinivibrio dextrinosolvens]SFJ74848.1 hypothetical protein SAMN04487865_1001144 [Succinivibrio dextrinosolvens]
MANEGYEIGWDDEVEQDGGDFVLLDEGEYSFTVSKFERGRFPGSSKIPPCNKAILTLTIDSPQGRTSVNSDLIMYSSMEWKLSQFLRSIGLKKEGEKVRVKWDQLVGKKGRCLIKHRSYTNKNGEDKLTNDIERFLDFDGSVENSTPALKSSAVKKTQANKPVANPDNQAPADDDLLS